MTHAPRAVIFGCAGLRLGAAERALFAQAQPWGAILFARNLDNADQIRALTADLRDAVGRDLPILIDQEGGRVQRLTPPLWRGFLPPLDVARTSPDPARAFWLRGRLIAAELSSLGIDVNCAPVADIARPNTHPVLHNRCMGETVATVARHARAMADGLLAGGVLPVVKHIPGHGRATRDSHHDLPVVLDAPEVLASTDFAAFAALSDLPLGMSAHLVYQQIDPAYPATTSPRMIAMIRDQIGFGGALMSDDISMQALSGPVQERARAALGAGCDLVLHCNGVLEEMRALADACPPLAGAALVRTDAALGLRGVVQEVDLAALDDEHAALMRPELT
jgi:beta-N-acetylhexosaminidase